MTCAQSVRALLTPQLYAMPELTNTAVYVANTAVYVGALACAVWLRVPHALAPTRIPTEARLHRLNQMHHALALSKPGAPRPGHHVHIQVRSALLH